MPVSKVICQIPNAFEGDMHMKVFTKAAAYVLAAVLCLCCVCAYAEGEEWACPGCGAANTTNFCVKCGTAKPEEIICQACGAKYPLDSGVVFCGDCGAKLEQGKSFISVRYEGDGFSSPEEAVTCYMEGYKNLDMDQILGAFSWETQASRLSVEKNAERLGAYNPALFPRMPAFNEFMTRATVEAIRATQVRMIYAALESYILGEEAPNGVPIPLDSPEAVTEFMNKFDNGKLENLALMTNIRFVSPDEVTKGMFSNEINQRSFMKQTAYYNADEVVNIVGFADVGGETFFCIPTVARYGDRWYLVSVNSMTANILGIAIDLQAFACGKDAEELLP